MREGVGPAASRRQTHQLPCQPTSNQMSIMVLPRDCHDPLEPSGLRLSNHTPISQVDLDVPGFYTPTNTSPGTGTPVWFVNETSPSKVMSSSEGHVWGN